MRKSLFYLISVFFLFYSHAGKTTDFNITITGALERTKTISVNKITPSADLPDCTMLTGTSGGSNHVEVDGVNRFTLTKPLDGTKPTGILSAFFYAIENGGQEVCVGRYSEYKIYKTNIEGIGISYNDGNLSNSPRGRVIPVFPDLLKQPSNVVTANSLTHLYVIIRLWKISPAFSQLPSASYVIEGPKVLHFAGPGSTANRYLNCNTEEVNASGKVLCTIIKATASVTTTIYTPTCDFVNSSKVVQMGSHEMPTTAAEGFGTNWVDASFQIKCPPSLGYYKDPVNPGTVTKNQSLIIKIIPYTSSINKSQGILAVEGADDPLSSGAKGVGIQLAWGTPGEQGTTPGNAVELEEPLIGSDISPAINAGPYNAKIINFPFGGVDTGTLKMSARYIRLATSVPVKPGPANAKVEVLVNYN